MPPSLAFHLKYVALLIPCLRHTSAVDTRPPVPARVRPQLIQHVMVAAMKIADMKVLMRLS